MSVKNLNELIYGFFATGWATALRTESIAYPNMPHSSEADQAWVRVNIIQTDADNPSLGGGWKRTSGIVLIQVFVPVNTGDLMKSEMCDAALNVLENQKTGQYVKFQRGTVTDDGASPDGAWWQARVIVPFRYEEKT